jgi:hypothetical protein
LRFDDPNLKQSSGAIMKFTLAAAAAVGALVASQPAAAWGWRGHEIVGSIAQQILETKDPTAWSKVNALLQGHSLAVVSTWPDCAKDVSKTGAGFAYHTTTFTPKVCSDNFDSQAEIAAMVDYVSRNWSQCDYVNGGQCHGAYHFADVAIQRGEYKSGEVGTNDHDVVHAINAAIAVLEGKPSPAPFDIKSQSEALKLLAHFVGDIHQPLHVGAVYLNADGDEVDPDPPNSFKAATFTKGGNDLTTGKTGNLHHDWDTIATSYGTAASASVMGEAQNAKKIPPTPGDYHDWAGAWASDTVVQAQTAIAPLSFGDASGGAKNTWPVQFKNKATYAGDRAKAQRMQLEKAGAHLAALLIAVCDQPSACNGN